MKPIIEVRNISKRYKISHERGGYVSLRDVLMNVVKRPFAFLKDKALTAAGLEKKEEFWALKDVSFNVEKGEVVGVIGANGAGKSTLLKILSQITPPTEGEVVLRGRVGSLLEVGTGFHPELTGRENIFLNGAILGMRRREIAAKFDQIVEFAGIEKFLDTPVKYYSSGMYVRLAFSVAAHMEPDILIVDEVLAVGDAEFQKKCLGKMREITKKEGRTVIFVSHNMSAISGLCERVILLSGGVVAKDGPAADVIGAYLHAGMGPAATKSWDESAAPGDSIVRLYSASITQDGKPASSADIRKPIGLAMEYKVTEGGHALYPNFHLYNEEGICIFIAADHDKTWRGKPRQKGLYTTRTTIPGNLLSEGMVRVTPVMTTLTPLTVHFEERDAIAFHVIDSMEGDSARGEYTGKVPGVIRPLLEWKTDFRA